MRNFGRALRGLDSFQISIWSRSMEQRHCAHNAHSMQGMNVDIFYRALHHCTTGVLRTRHAWANLLIQLTTHPKTHTEQMLLSKYLKHYLTWTRY